MKSPKDMRIIQIDITNACQYQCSNCTRFVGHHKKPYFMDYETFKRAVDSLIGYHGTIGIMGGEPTLHPQFEQYIQYLHEKLPKDIKKNNTVLIHPQKNFIDAIYSENLNFTEVYHYQTGNRDTIQGAGLWSAMVPTYKKYYERIQDVFRMQAVNDHGNTMYHSPIFINRKDLGIEDKEWFKIRDNCWAQCIWSATITPNGAFFCEIAGALDMLFNGPGGWPIEPGWWKRSPEEFGDQVKWCEYCGIAIDTFTRNANDWVDDISPSMYKLLQEIGSPKLKHKERINLVKIKDGKILDESLKGVKEVRHEAFYDVFGDRFNKEKSILTANLFSIIIDFDVISEEDLEFIDKNIEIFDHICIISTPNHHLDKYKSNSKISIVMRDVRWGCCFKKALESLPKDSFTVYSDSKVIFIPSFVSEYKELFLNPGTMQVSEPKKCDYIEVSSNKGLVALFNPNANSLREFGTDRILNANSFSEILSCWEQHKVIAFDRAQIQDHSFGKIVKNGKYAIYGASGGGIKTFDFINSVGGSVVAFSDSDPTKWGTECCGIKVISPEELLKIKDTFDCIAVGSIYFSDILRYLLSLGFKHSNIAELS